MTANNPSDTQGVRDDEGTDFGRFRIFPRLRILMRSGVKVEIGPRAIDILWLLVRANGELVTKDYLLETVWSGVVVEENNLQAQMSAIRRALGSDRDMIRTEFGLGYRLVRKQNSEAIAERVLDKLVTRALPIPLTPLLGRDRELLELGGLFDKSRLLTIVGSGGVGKTRSALEFAQRLADRDGHDVRLAEMAKIFDAQLVEASLANALLIPSLDIHHIREAVGGSKASPLTLIVDNCEHLSGAIAEAIEALLTNAPHIKILTTSQEPLGISGEQVYRLGPLSVPPQNITDIKTAMQFPAFELLVERASANMQTFQIDVELASAICRRLDGLPLALELAAARVATLGLNGVLAALNDRFNLLTAGRKTALAKHRTLRATVDWSYHLLDADEQLMLRRISVFSSQFDVAAVRAVAAQEKSDPWYAVDILGRLVSKSLLLLDLSQTRPHYRFLESIRFYALEKLADDADLKRIMERYAAHILTAARHANEDWKTLSTDEWRSTHAGIIDDLRGALDWSFSINGDIQVGTSILACATPYWVQLSLHDECRNRISDALERFADSLAPSEEMALQAALGTALSWAVGPVSEADGAWQRALYLARTHRASEIELQARYGLWLVNLRSGRFQASLDHSREMLRCSLDAGDPEAAAVAERIAGVSQHFSGNHDLARELLERSIHWFQVNRPPQRFRFGIDQSVAGKSFLARTLWVLGRVDEAKDVAGHAVSEAMQLDHANTLCCALAEGDCTVYGLEGDVEAVRHAVAALRHAARQHGLGFWDTYAAVFDTWATVESGQVVPSFELSSLVEAVIRAGFHPKYSNLFSDILLAVERNAWDKTPLLPISNIHMQETDTEPCWADVEFRRAAFHLAGSASATMVDLWDELEKARTQNALSWALKIGIDLASREASDGLLDKAIRALAELIEEFPDHSSGRYVNAARSICKKSYTCCTKSIKFDC
ncbi:transcriptional regulatory, C terminal family protein (plasmid) [Ochrobactrum quorumnocens]|uniref:Transcriptional regulatory, C terminal family protein n=1 Tax=Ochrobactrum quorumnocens TaxID=271865 RepID=A0A248UN52_9HYPH|nr:winged helix-turn-helix domain-containing protein [[Ochrobactrum] quorumnocens]ASV88155.1 transcriptional regulatory, C terminal family protein [[Ochrobactrum] quorumnocens]